ncbi:unnamed protein product [Dicrocoelium dendriticum]|nr:unnamed protein product [Dicrocoelium dendriticum]
MLKHRASAMSSVCPIGLGPMTLKNSICSVGQLILEQHSKCFGKFIYHSETDNESSKVETTADVPYIPEITNSLLLDWVAGQHEMHLAHPARISVVIEMLILSDVCRKHLEADKLSAFVVEQWTITYSTNSLMETQGDDMISLQKEIEGYFVSSPFSFWLREHFQSKRLRLFHRICSAETVSPQLGVPFFTTFDQLCSPTPCVYSEARPVNVDVGRCSYDLSTTTGVDKRCCSSDSKLTRSFTPLPVNPSGLLHLTVVTPERMPTSRPGCPLCMIPSLDRTEGNHLEAFWPRAYYDSSDKSSSLSNPPTAPAPHISMKSFHLIDSPSFLDLSSDIVYTETVRSPVVLMTNVQQSHFSDYSISSQYDNGFPSVGCFEHSNDSDTSTLTKKSRSVHPNETPPISLGSPPRKQQRRTSKDKGSSSHMPEHRNANELHGVEHSQAGSIDRVISEFTQLNMEREILQSCDPHLQASFFIQPDDPRLSSIDSLSDARLTRSSTKKREHTSNVNLSVVQIPSSSNPLIHGHLPRERRRNATSTCIPSWRHGMPFFNRRTGLPLQSSPVPLKRSTSGRFDFDSSLCPLKSSKSSACMVHNCGPSYALEPSLRHSDLPLRCSHQQCSTTSTSLSSQPTTPCVQLRRRPASLRLNLSSTEGAGDRSLRRRNCAPEVDQAEISCSAPPSGNRKSAYSVSHRTRLANTLACTPASHCSSQHLLVNFEESMLNGRIHPSGQVEGFTLELGASGSFFPTHERIPLKTYFFDLSDDNKPSPYLAYADLCHLRSGKGYHLPSKGSVQISYHSIRQIVPSHRLTIDIRTREVRV